jgi:hypothetical protein
MRKIFLLAALVAAVLSDPHSARAQESDDAEVTKMAKEHYKAGLDAYKNGQYDVAIKELKRAYLLKRLPPLLLNIGATYRKMGDLDLALHFYKKYIDEAPPDAKDRGDVENTIKDIEKQKAAGGGKPVEATPTEPTKDDTPPPPKKPMPTEWRHTVVDAAPPGSPLDVRVSMPVMKGVKVFVFYRAAGEADFQQVLMKRRGPEKVGRIPGDAMQGNAMQYYIEARDPQGSVVQSSGSQTSPNIVMIDPNAPPQMLASLDSSREPRDGEPQEPSEPTTRRDRDEEDAPLLVQEGKKKKERERRVATGNNHMLRTVGFVLLGVGVGAAAVGGGVGFGLAKRQSDAVAQDSRAMAPFLFNDPAVHDVGGDDATFEKNGKMYDLVGISMSAIGGALAVAGAALIAVDAVKFSGGGKEKPRRRPARDDTSWYITPTAGVRQVGVSGGFTFEGL